MLKTKIIKVVVLSIISAISAINVSANLNEKNAVSLAVKGLSQQLQSDLAINKVNLKLKEVKNQNVSNDKVIVSGTGTVQNAKKISVTFDVAVNPVKAEVIDVKYDIVSPIAVGPATAAESFLMKEVMGKIKTDYKTNEIVIAIDGFETVKTVDGKTNYVGVAEVRVGMEWSRIEFDVQGDAKTRTASNITYKVVE